MALDRSKRSIPRLNSQVSSPSSTSAAPTSRHRLAEGLQVELVPAPRMRRFLALCVDYGLISLVFYVVIFVAFILAGGVMISGKWVGGLTAGIGVIILLVVVVLAFATFAHGYFIYFENRLGTTPGKRMFGLKVISLTSDRLSLQQVVVRELLRSYIDVPLILPGLISVFVSEKRQRVGDMAAQTMVVHSRSQELQQGSMYVNREDYLLLREHLQPAEIDSQTITSYLKFAYQEFLAHSVETSSVERASWLARLHSYLPKAKELGLTDDTILLFFAEHCTQIQNSHLTKGHSV